MKRLWFKEIRERGLHDNYIYLRVMGRILDFKQTKAPYHPMSLRIAYAFEVSRTLTEFLRFGNRKSQVSSKSGYTFGWLLETSIKVDKSIIDNLDRLCITVWEIGRRGVLRKCKRLIVYHFNSGEIYDKEYHN